MRLDGTTSAFSGDWRKPLAVGIWLSMIAIVAYLVVRDESQAKQVSNMFACCLSALAMVAGVTANLLVHPLPVSLWRKRQRFFGGLATLVTPLAIGLLLTDQHSTMSATVLAVIFGIGSICIVAGPEFMRTTPRRRHAKLMLTTTPVQVQRSVQSPDVAMTSRQAAATQLPLPANARRKDVVQWFARRITDDGDDQLEGTVKVEFAPGQRESAVHIPFSPSFSVEPEVKCEAVDRSDLRTSVTTVYTYGARLQIKRAAQNDERLEAEIAFIATAPVSKADAA